MKVTCLSEQPSESLHMINTGASGEKRNPLALLKGVWTGATSWGTVWRLLQKLKIELAHDPAVPLLGTHPNNTIIWKDTCTSMFLAALFTTAKMWRQPKRPPTEEWIQRCGTCIPWNVTQPIKEANDAICSILDEPRGYHTKWSKSKTNTTW